MRSIASFSRLGVVVPTKDRPRDLVACITSLDVAASAAGARVKVIVCDDGAGQSKAEQVASSGLGALSGVDVVYARNPGPAGAAGARNHAVRLLDTDLIGFLDDDATVARNWVTMALQECRPGFATTGRIESSGGTDLFTLARQARYDQRRASALSTGWVSFLAGGNSVVSRDDYDRAGGFDTSFRMMHDRDLALRLERIGVKIHYCDELVIYHRHFKDVVTYVMMTASSGRYRRRLENRWPQVGGWRFDDVLTSARKCQGSVLIRSVIALSEILHGIGYSHERILGGRDCGESVGQAG